MLDPSEPAPMLRFVPDGGFDVPGDDGPGEDGPGDDGRGDDGPGFDGLGFCDDRTKVKGVVRGKFWSGLHLSVIVHLSCGVED